MKLVLITAAILTATSATAQMTLQEKIAADQARDPYAEAPSLSQQVVIDDYEIVEEYIEPEAAEQMKPSKHFKLERGNTVVVN